MAIIIMAPEIELHADWMEWGLKEAGFDVIRWAGLGWRLEDSATIYSGDDEEVYLGSYRLSPNDTVWLRRPELITHPDVDLLDQKFAAGEYEAFRRNVLLHVALSGARCINKWSSVLTIDNKSLQLSLARQCGLRVPATRLGNSGSFVRDFVGRPGADVVHKAFRPHSWVAANGAIRGCETTRLQGYFPDETYAYAPGIYQQRIQKVLDVRINMIDREFHSFALTTPAMALDWRSHGIRNEVQAERISLPAAVQLGLRAFADRADLVFGCFDMVVDNAGEWWFLEVNQAGQFLWIDLIQPDDGVYEPMLRFLSATEPVSHRPFPTFRRCLAECEIKQYEFSPQKDSPYQTVESELLASA
ncbi:MAG: hypothetical protein ACJ74Y_19140 [Bryobacteraceae bacterium]